MKPHNLPVGLYRFLAEKVFEYTFLKFPQPLKLSMMAGIEHFTAVLAEYMMKHEDHFYHSDDEKGRALRPIPRARVSRDRPVAEGCGCRPWLR
jgi:hypothetical protein